MKGDNVKRNHISGKPALQGVELQSFGLAVMRIKVYTILELEEILGQRELEVSVPSGSTVKDFISWMVESWGEPLSSKLFCSGSDRLLPHIRLMVNGRTIESLRGMETVLQDGDEFLMVPFVAGG